MPVTGCNKNGKPGYKWGQSGNCYPYNPKNEASQKKAKNNARKQGIAEIINNFEMSIQLAGSKVSFDYDGVLSTNKGKSLAKERIAKGQEVYIITARMENGDNESLFNIAKELGISKDHIHFTNHKDKWEEIKRLGINIHYDNNKEQIDKINQNTDAKGILI